MAKRRKVGNLLALAVLAVVVQRPMHPYEMASVLRARDTEENMKIKWGSLYTVVQNLEKHGFLEAVESERQGGRPERTIYRITEAGFAELEDWVRELVSSPEPEQVRFQAGLSVLAVLGPDEVAVLMRQRLDLLTAQIAERREHLREHSAQLPRLFLIETEYDLVIREAEAEWTRALVAELEAGAFPGQDDWRTFHRTRELPADLAEMADRGRVAD